ncbi:nmrA family transcriptional regulator [Aspergillus californicus]
MSDKKIIVVFGATGIQGGSVARSILNDPTAAQQFHVRAVTRDPSKPAAKALADLGAELIKANLEDKVSLRAAFQDAYGVFLLTTIFDTMDKTAETRQGKNAADVCKETGVKHLVFSSLPHVSKVTNGKLTKVVHFDSKALVDEYIRELDIPHSILHVGTYIELLLGSLAPLSPENPSKYGFFFPEPASLETEFPLIDPAQDVGKFVKAILLNPKESLGRKFNAYDRIYTVAEFVEILNKNGVDVVFQAIDDATFRAGLAAQSLPDFWQESIVQVMQYAITYGFFTGETQNEGHKLLTEPLTSLEDALKTSPVFAGLAKK